MIPIGQPTVEFTGVYDGDGYNIVNLWSDSLADHGGLFGKADGAKFKNINLINVIIVSASNNFMGGLVGYAENMTEDSIYNCHVSGVINESNAYRVYIGGVVGRCDSITGIYSINKCSFEGNIKSSVAANGYIGGICGSCSTYKNSYSSGNIVSISNMLGGLCGVLYQNNVCSYSYSLVNINEGLNAVGDIAY